MLRLHFTRGVCSLAPHIVLKELGLPHELVPFVPSAPLTPEFERLNPLGYVPVLELGNGKHLTEVAAILLYLADLQPEARLAPPPGTPERYELYSRLNFIASEVHKGFGPFFTDAQKEIRGWADSVLSERMNWLSLFYERQPWMLEWGFSIADIYLFVVLGWSKYAGFDLGRWPNLVHFSERMRDRPATRAALDAEKSIRLRT